MSVAEAHQGEHRAFLNRYYGWSRKIYDVTRKYYLFGRDTAIDRMLEEPWDSLVEIGPGTGRNLRKIRSKRPHAKLGGIDASDAMLEHARKKCPWASLSQGFAEQADYSKLFGAPPDRVLFSYCLSMVQEKEKALAHALSQVAPGGEVWVVDFSDLGGLRQPMRGMLQKWLATFHVKPLDIQLLHDHGAGIEHGPLHYYVIGRLRRPA